MDDVHPILMSQVDWRTLTEILQSTFGFSPTRILDENNIPLDRPSAFLCAINYPPHQPNETLSGATRFPHLFEHAVYGFVVVTDQKYAVHFYRLGFAVQEFSSSDNYALLVTGNVKQWYDAVICSCVNERPQRVRLIYNRIMSYLERAGYQPLWQEYDKVHLVDKTFTLKRR